MTGEVDEDLKQIIGSDVQGVYQYTGPFGLPNYGEKKIWDYNEIELLMPKDFNYSIGELEPKGIRKIEDWYMAPLLYPDYIHELHSLQADIAISNFDKINKSMGKNIDVVFTCGTDFGSQRAPLSSKETFMEFYHPYYKKMNDWIHQNTSWKTLKHSCGAIADIIPGLIDSGFDCLNPIQSSCPGMKPEKLKSEFGENITFWGGGVDTQHILPFATPEEVRNQVLRRCEIFSKDGRFVFNTIHIIQAKTPIKNIIAIIDAIKEFNK